MSNTDFGKIEWHEAMTAEIGLWSQRANGELAYADHDLCHVPGSGSDSSFSCYECPMYGYDCGELQGSWSLAKSDYGRGSQQAMAAAGLVLDQLLDAAGKM